MKKMTIQKMTVAGTAVNVLLNLIMLGICCSRGELFEIALALSAVFGWLCCWMERWQHVEEAD